jgi:hypothetical protein
MTLEEFKQTVREQYFSLVLDPEGALAVIPDMLPADATKRKRILEAIRRIADAAGPATGEKAARLAKLEQLFASGGRGASAEKAPRKAARRAMAGDGHHAPTSDSRATARGKDQLWWTEVRGAGSSGRRPACGAPSAGGAVRREECRLSHRTHGVHHEPSTGDVASSHWSAVKRRSPAWRSCNR